MDILPKIQSLQIVPFFDDFKMFNPIILILSTKIAIPFQYVSKRMKIY